MPVELRRKMLTGIPASSGKARGIVRVVRSEGDFTGFQDGDVLVTRITDPTMTILMNKASAIVCDIGGITSHPAILSRELGIPCLVNTGNATAVLKEGLFVEVDADEGIVYALD